METKLVKNLSFSKQYKCCDGTPTEIKCYKNNPNWDPNWREKRKKGYNTYTPKNHIMINFVFEEIKIGG